MSSACFLFCKDGVVQIIPLFPFLFFLKFDILEHSGAFHFLIPSMYHYKTYHNSIFHTSISEIARL